MIVLERNAMLQMVPYIKEYEPAAAVSPQGDGWQNVDAFLSVWSADPESVVDYDAVAPSRDVIRLARRIAKIYQTRNMPSPSMVVPDGRGGISLEFHFGDEFLNIEILSDLKCRVTLIRQGKVELREPLF